MNTNDSTISRAMFRPLSEDEMVDRLNALSATTGEDVYKQRLAEFSSHCQSICQLTNDYFKPPSLMSWKDETGMVQWEVFVRRKGSDAEFVFDGWKDVVPVKDRLSGGRGERVDDLSDDDRMFVEAFREKLSNIGYWTLEKELIEIIDRLAPKPEGV